MLTNKRDVIVSMTGVMCGAGNGTGNENSSYIGYCGTGNSNTLPFLKIHQKRRGDRENTTENTHIPRDGVVG